MNFAGAIFALQRGHKVKRHHWSGYWYLAPMSTVTLDKCETDTTPTIKAVTVQTIMMHTYDGREIDIRQTSDIIYTLSNCACDDWEIVEDWDKKTEQDNGYCKEK